MFLHNLDVGMDKKFAILKTDRLTVFVGIFKPAEDIR